LIISIFSGVVLSVGLSFWKVTLLPEEITLIWATTLLFLIGGVRFGSISYSVGLLCTISFIVNLFPPLQLPGLWNKLWVQIAQFHSESWLWLAGGLHFLEWILVRFDGDRGCFPVLMNHETNGKVNGFMLRKGWPIPLLLNIPLLGYLPVPIFLSFSRLTLSKPIEQQRRLSSTLYLLLGLIICSFLFLSLYSKLWLWGAALFSLLGHEVIYQVGKWHERREEPLYVSNERGLKVFAVLPNSPGAAMGIKIGDIVQRLNGHRIYTHSDLERAVKDAAFCKLEVLDEFLDRHMMQKALYQDDPRHLGIVGAVPENREQKEIS